MSIHSANKLSPVVILAGGLATRLHPLTTTIPKSLIAINGQPFVYHQLRLLKRAGFNEIIFCLGFLGEQIENLIGNGQQFGLTVNYIYDGQQLLGTGGAIKKALALVQECFFVLYGDSYLSCDFLEVQKKFIASKKLGLMTVYHNKGKWDTSNIEFDGTNILIYDKNNRTPQMHYIDYGLGIFNKRAFAQIPHDSPYDLALLYQDLLKKGELAAYETMQRFYEIGSFAGIKELEYYLCGKADCTL